MKFMKDMKRRIRIGTVADQDCFRRDDVLRMSPNRRVSLLLDMQRRFLAWDDAPPMPRQATIRCMDDQPHAP